jgi:hypothetical protein
MPWIVTTENPGAEARRFLRHWADPGYVERQLRSRQSGVARVRRRTRARQIARSVHQGLAFLANADDSATPTKPLTLFYGAENLCKAACVWRDPQLLTDDLSSHGLSGERGVSRYSIKTIRCRVRRPRKDVWSHVARNFNHDRFSLEVRPSGEKPTVSDQVNRHGTLPAGTRQLPRFGDLIRHLPELLDDGRPPCGTFAFDRPVPPGSPAASVPCPVTRSCSTRRAREPKKYAAALDSYGAIPY